MLDQKVAVLSRSSVRSEATALYDGLDRVGWDEPSVTAAHGDASMSMMMMMIGGTRR